MVGVFQQRSVKLPTSTFQVNLGHIIKEGFFSVLRNIESVTRILLFDISLCFFLSGMRFSFIRRGPEQAPVGCLHLIHPESLAQGLSWR